MLENKALQIYDRIEYLERIFNTDTWSILSEEQSTFPFAKAILDCVFRYMKEHKQESLVKRVDGGFLYHFEVPYRTFRFIDTFFYGIDLTINCYERFGTGNFDFLEESKYMTKDAKLIEGKKLYNPKIIINYIANYGEIYYSLIGPLMHELLHAYENYKRLMNNAPSLETVSNSSMYESIKKNLKYPPYSPQYHIAKMFYFFIRCERNAFISQMHGEIEKMSRSQNFRLTSISKIIKSLSLYDEFERIDNDIQFFKHELTGKDECSEVLKTVEEISGRRFGDYQNAVQYLEDYTVAEESMVVQKIKRIIRKYQEKQGSLQENIDAMLKEDLRRRGCTKSVLNHFEWFDNMINYGKEKEKDD